MTTRVLPAPSVSGPANSNARVAKERFDVERVRVWQCIGCGKIDAPKPCIGVCEDRAQEMVCAADYDALAAEAAQLRAVVLRIAGVTPHDGTWKQSWQALKLCAEKTLAATRPVGTGGKP